MSRHLAIDLGAESGRVILGTLNKGKLQMREVHRFANGAVTADGTLRWDILRLFREIRIGLAKGARGGRVDSIACDSWGVDYVLTKGDGPALSLPYTYRDERTFAAFARGVKIASPRAAFAATGIASLSINTLYQLLDDVENRPEVLKLADRFLLIGDYISWLLSDVARGEETLVSGSQLWDTRKRRWAWPLIDRMGIPRRLFPKVVKPGTKLGQLRPELARETGLVAAKVVATCAHDTAAAVATRPYCLTARSISFRSPRTLNCRPAISRSAGRRRCQEEPLRACLRSRSARSRSSGSRCRRGSAVIPLAA